LNKRLTTIAIISFACSLLFILLTVAIIPTYADTPSSPHNADAMWVEPATVSVTPSMVGQLFNVTVALNMTEDIYGWQTMMHFNATLFNCTRSGYTSGVTSNYFTGHTTTAPGASIDNVRGTMLIYESCLGASDFIAGPHTGTLFWAEFIILSVPANLNTDLNISREAGTGSLANTWVVKSDGITYLQFTAYDGIVAPEFLTILLLPALMAATIGAIIASKRMSRKKLK
jgi:hypothetical protein